MAHCCLKQRLEVRKLIVYLVTDCVTDCGQAMPICSLPVIVFLLLEKNIKITSPREVH